MSIVLQWTIHAGGRHVWFVGGLTCLSCCNGLFMREAGMPCWSSAAFGGVMEPELSCTERGTRDFLFYLQNLRLCICRINRKARGSLLIDGRHHCPTRQMRRRFRIPEYGIGDVFVLEAVVCPPIRVVCAFQSILQYRLFRMRLMMYIFAARGTELWIYRQNEPEGTRNSNRRMTPLISRQIPPYSAL